MSLFWSDFIFKDSFEILNFMAKKFSSFVGFTVYYGQIII